ncbi:uncharacterized DUF497 family protein [Rhodoblastus sphagnicola]|uniref:BrnT family toxin n=1 Tax=Rhodoblastus sphagnicola TaxID=333368 RepID=UPI001857A063|nr:uncharacterized DUF497 family protein [Rhodoblastus sphagnicola]
MAQLRPNHSHLVVWAKCVYTMYEWDETKRQTNLAKHKLDFVDAVLMFDGRPTLTAPSNTPVEARFVTTAMIHAKF